MSKKWISDLLRDKLYVLKKVFQKKTHRELKKEEGINVEKGSTCSNTLVLYYTLTKKDCKFIKSMELEKVNLNNLIFLRNYTVQWKEKVDDKRLNDLTGLNLI